ncbi:MAG: hypothetical protein LBS27_03810, partial [Bifidobacteriaceae bacterium]|nr:hypothetical protein [Bifidobacteriaceae bacterium]
MVAAGDVRVMIAVEGDRLMHGLADYSANSDGDPLDVANAVLAVPTAEAWPGGNEGEDASMWERIEPGRGDVWRTSAGGLGANELALSLDSSAIVDGTVHPSSRWGGGVFTRLGSVTGPGFGALLVAGVEVAGTTLSASDAAGWLPTSAAGALDPSQMSVAVAFTTSGRYCVTLQTLTQLAGAGTVLNNDVTLTFAVGEIDPSTVEPCAQPDAIPSQAPQPVDADADGVTVIDSGLALFGSTLTDEDQLSLDLVTSDRARTTSYDPSEVVLSLPNRDTAWPGTAYGTSVQANWARIADAGSLLWRTTGQYPNTRSASIDERANSLVLDLEAMFVDASRLDPEQPGVAYRFIGAATTSASGHLATYRSDSADGGVVQPGNVAFWDSRAGGERIDQWASATELKPFYTAEKQTHLIGSQALGFAFTEAGVYCVSLETSATLANGAVVADSATFTFAVGVDATTVTPCAQDTGQPGGGDSGDDSGGDSDGELDPTVTWMREGHVDLALQLDGAGGLQFVTGDANTFGLVPLEDAVWVGRGSYATFTVREPSDTQDVTFIGDVGSTYYGF